MKTRDDTHVPLPDFPAYTVDEMQARAAAFHAAMVRACVFRHARGA